MDSIVFLQDHSFKANFRFFLCHFALTGIGLIKAVPPLWSTLFFLMMLALGFGSEFSIMETTMIMVIDIFKTKLNTRLKQILTRLVICIVYFLLGLVMATKVSALFCLLVSSSLAKHSQL
jgi:solute carrier family 6 amino acid transporter-like protein 5/7/9/14